MLIQFRVENHRSLRDEQTLSLVAARNIGSDGDDCLIRPKGLDEALLPAVALYGANASGKTNVLLALDLMRNVVRDSHRLWEPEAGVPQQPFALSDTQHAPSLYEVDVLVANVRYQYGFVLSAYRIEEEWLYAWPNGRKQAWFEREGGDFNFGRHLGGENETIRTLTRSNSLFLSASAQNNHSALLPIFGWFQRLRLELRRRETFLSRLDGLGARLAWQEVGGDEGLRIGHETYVQLLRSADLGIVDFRIASRLNGGSDGRPGRNPDVVFWHKADSIDRIWLPVEAQSAGTITLLDLATSYIPILSAGGVLCVDELEASLHPMLAAALVRLFCDPKQNPNGAQLIFTTHDTNLLGNVPGFTPLRRDQIWLTEKDDVGATHLYPLTDFHPRKHENLERGYLQGRYGAVPFLGDLLDNDVASEYP